MSGLGIMPSGAIDGPISAFTHHDIASGIWKFNKTVDPEMLLEFAMGLKKGPDGDRYLDLHIRDCGKDGRRGIGFQYRFPMNSNGYQKFFYEMKDKLMRRFGAGFEGWDVSSPTTIISKTA